MKRGLFTSCTAVSMGIAFAAAAQQVTVTGCAEAGVENGCIVMKDGDKLYNITRATPKPTANTYGTVTGTASDGIDLCQQGTLLTAAQWKPDASKVGIRNSVDVHTLFRICQGTPELEFAI